MANALYDKGRQKFLEGGIAWLTDNIKAILVDTALYTVDLALDDFLDDVPVGSRVQISANLTGKDATDGVADAADEVFGSVSGATVEAIVIYRDSGVEGTSELIAYIDSATGLPVTPNGGDITVQWDNGVDKIFKL